MVHIAPSILSADFSKLGDQVREVDAAGAQRIHIDVMDGHFVPNLSMGPEVVRGLRPITKLPLEVHLMVEQPDKFIDFFADAGADSFIVHKEVLPDPKPLIDKIHGMGKKVGLAINPDKPVDLLKPYLADIDLALCMTVYPGFSGQKYVPGSPERIRQLRQYVEENNPQCELEVDGGINDHTGPESVQAGANVLVMASAVFHHPQGPTAAVKGMMAKVGGK